MNGFIYTQGAEAWNGCEKRIAAVLGTQSKFERTPVGADEACVTWGSDYGDIHLYSSRTSALVLCGYVSEIEGMNAGLAPATAAACILEHLDRDIESLAGLLKRLHGSFALLYRNHTKRVLLAASDRMGSRPLWHAWTRSGWMLSSHPLAIGAVLPELKTDLGALGAFLLYGGPVDPCKSLYSGLRALPPGTVVAFEEAGRTVNSEWYRFRHAPQKRSRTDWLELCAERMLRSASRIAAQCPRPAVFFSGGVDSRLTAAALKGAGANPLLVTLGDARNLEVRVSAQAAKALGLQHVVLLRDKHWYLQALPRLVGQTGGSFLWTHGHFSKAVVRLQQEFDVTGFFLGDFCEAFSKLFCVVPAGVHGPWKPGEFAEAFDQLRLPLYRPRARERTLSLVSPGIRKEVLEGLRYDLLASYERTAWMSEDPWIIGDLAFRWASVSTLPTFFMFHDLRSAAPERNLMFDSDVHSLLEELPSGLRNGRNFGAQLIRRLNWKAAWALNSNSLLPMCWPPFLHKVSRKCKPLLGKARRAVLGSTHKTTGAWPEKAALYAADPLWRQHFERILFSGALESEELFDSQAVRQSWAALSSGDRSRAADLEKLVQLGMLNQSLATRNTSTSPVPVL